MDSHFTDMTFQVPVRQPCAWVMFWDRHVDIRLPLGPRVSRVHVRGWGEREKEQQEICSRVGWQNPSQCCFSFFRWALLKMKKGRLFVYGKQTRAIGNKYDFSFCWSFDNFCVQSALAVISPILIYSSWFGLLSLWKYLCSSGLVSLKVSFYKIIRIRKLDHEDIKTMSSVLLWHQRGHYKCKGN